MDAIQKLINKAKKNDDLYKKKFIFSQTMFKKDGNAKEKYKNLTTHRRKKVGTQIYLYPNTWKNKGRTLTTDMGNITKALDMAKIKYKIGNDAPRGGQEGDYITLTPTAVKYLEAL